jgi:DNA-binding response OmpR family regulator
MKARILIVDDEEQLRTSLHELLSLEGYEVETAESGKEALQMLPEGGYDLMLLDLRMPGIDGIEVMRSASKSSPDTRIIVLTGHGSEEAAIESIRHSVHDYLKKPVEFSDLLTSIARALAGRAEQREKHRLLDDLETKIRRLKDVEGVYGPSTSLPTVMTLDNGVTVDLTRREMWRGQHRVSLTPTEGKLMKVLLEHRAQVLSHQDLVMQVQGYEANEWEAPEVLRPLVSRLRRKLSVFPNGERWISNVRGTGYVFDETGVAS